MKQKSKIFPTHSLIENDDFFYRDSEMYRATVDDDVFELNEFIYEKLGKNKNKIYKNINYLYKKKK